MKPLCRAGLASCALALGAASLLLLSPSAEAAKTPVYAITNARVMPVSGPIMDKATLVLRDGLILEVGTSATVPKDARVFDGTGLTITPGLIDAFSGAGMPPPRSGRGGAGGGGAPAAEPTPDPVAPASHLYELVKASEALKVRDSGVTTIVPVPREGLIHGAAAVMNLAGDKPESMVVKSRIALAASMNSLRQRYPDSLMGVVALLRQALIDGSYHRDEVAAYEKAPAGKKRPAFDPGLEVWADVASGALPLMLQTPRIGDLRRALALADEFGVKLVLAGNTHASEEAALLKERKPALLVSVNYDPPQTGGFFGGSDDDKTRAEIERAEKNPAALNKEGIPFALVSGFATDFLAGIRKAIDQGLPREVALRAVTLTPAEILGVADRMGSLEKGKIGNAVVWSGDPFAKEAKVKMVFVDGELYEPEEKPAAPPGAGGPAPSGAGRSDAVKTTGEVK